MEKKTVNYWFDTNNKELIVDTIYEVKLYCLRLNGDTCSRPLGLSSGFEEKSLIEFTASEFGQNFLDIPIKGNPAITKKQNPWLPLCEGKHHYRLVLGKFQYSGDFSFAPMAGENKKMNESDLEALAALKNLEKERIEKLTQEAKVRDKANQELAFKAQVEARTVPDYCYNAKGKFSDPQLSLSNIRRMAMKEKAVATILYLSIEDGIGDWEISWKQDVYPQIPVSKHTTRNICLVYKTPEGNCVKTNLTIIKDYINGTYEEPYAYFHFGSGYEFNGKLSCEKVRKQAVK